jgi:hypothetical protein
MDYSGWTEVYPSYGGIPRGYRVTLLWHDRVEKGKKTGIESRGHRSRKKHKIIVEIHGGRGAGDSESGGLVSGRYTRR